MANSDVIQLSGRVIEVLPSTTFKVQISESHIILAYLSGKLRRHNIKIILGDQVDLELSPYDLTKGRIVYRR